MVNISEIEGSESSLFHFSSKRNVEGKKAYANITHALSSAYNQGHHPQGRPTVTPSAAINVRERLLKKHVPFYSKLPPLPQNIFFAMLCIYFFLLKVQIQVKREGQGGG